MESAANASRGLGSKFLLTVIPGLVASGVAASVLYAIHVSRTPAVSEYLSEPTPHSDGLSAEERRDLTRQMLKARRDNPEQPAAVQPVSPDGAGSAPMDGDAAAAVDAANPDSRATDTGAADTAVRVVPSGADLPIRVPDVAVAPDAKPGDAGTDVRAVDAKPADPRPVDARPVDARPVDARPVEVRPADARPDIRPAEPARPQGGVAARTPPGAVATAPLPPPRPPVRPRPEAPAASASVRPAPPLPPPTVAAPPPPPPAAQPSLGAAPQFGAPPQAPAEAAAAPPEPQQRGFASNVLSGLSSVAGSAANATGNAANWVIDLPGKAVNAGGKLIGIRRDADVQSQSQAPAAVPPPPPPGSAAPPPPAKHL